jgi:hypothetical protein
MTDNYARIVHSNLERLYLNLPPDLARKLSARQSGECFEFDAFGAKCEIRPDGILLDTERQDGPVGILLSLYALGAQSELCLPEPFKAFKDFPDSMPYVGAFSSHTEQILLPHVERIEQCCPRIMEALHGGEVPGRMGGDFSFVVHPLPKIALCYIFYEADEDFPASATCLYSNNALSFLPIDGLADVGEYTSKKIIDIVVHA